MTISPIRLRLGNRAYPRHPLKKTLSMTWRKLNDWLQECRATWLADYAYNLRIQAARGAAAQAVCWGVLHQSSLDQEWRNRPRTSSTDFLVRISGLVIYQVCSRAYRTSLFEELHGYLKVLFHSIEQCLGHSCCNMRSQPATA